MSIIDDYKQLRMIENIKNFKQMGTAYKENLKLCEYQEKQINKLATCIEQIKEIAVTGLEGFCPKCSRKECEDNNCIETAIRDILQKISECERS